MKRLFKIIAVILIQAFLVMDFAWCGDISGFVSVDIEETSTLAPSLRLNIETIKNMFSHSAQQAAQQQDELGVNASRLRPYEIASQRVLIHNEATGKAVLGVVQNGKVEWQKEKAFWYGSLRLKELSGCALITISAEDLVCVAHVFPDNDARKISKLIQNIARQLRKTAGKLDNVQVNVIFSEVTFEELNFGKTKNYRLFAKAIGDNLEKEFGQERVSVDVQKGKLREMIFDARGKKWSFVNLNFKLFSRNLSGGSNIFKTWMGDVLYENDNILSAETIATLGEQLGIRQIDVLAAKAEERAKACIQFIDELPRDGKHNVYIFRDAAGLYAAHKMLRVDSPSAVYLSKKSFRTMTGLGVKADLLMLKIIEKALSRIGKKLSQQVDQDEYDEFKNEFFKAFEEELRQNENLRKAVRETLVYFDKEGILGHTANGFRFIDTTRKGTFPLFLEGVFSSPLTELGLWNEDLRGVSAESLMFYSNLSPAISFASNELAARRAESLSYPVEFSGEFDADFSPIFKETSEKDKNLFYLETVILRNEGLKKLRGEEVSLEDTFIEDIASRDVSLEKEDDLLTLADRSRICDLPNRQRYTEDLVEILQSGRTVQTAFLSIQNFKEEFNDLGAELDSIAGMSLVGHEFGDFGIQAVAKLLPRMLEEILADTGITFRIHNDAKSYWVIFENVPEDFDTVHMFDIMLRDYAEFRTNVVNEVKQRVEQILGRKTALGELSLESAALVRSRLLQMNWQNFNIYGGVSQTQKLSAERMHTAVAEAQRLDSQAILTAKYEQIGLGGEDLRFLLETSKRDGKSEQELTAVIMAHVDTARKMARSRIGLYDAGIRKDVDIHQRYGQRGEWEPMYRPIGLTYDEKMTYKRLFAGYEEARKTGDDALVKKAKEAIFQKMAFVSLDPSVRSRAKRPVFLGNERFKEMINYIIQQRPRDSWSGTFRIGGDEFGKLVWNAETGELFVFRFDINNLGKTNIQWGVTLGDKIIDEMSLLFDEIDNQADYMQVVHDFFNNRETRLGKYENEPLELEARDYAYIKGRLEEKGEAVSRFLQVREGRYYLTHVPLIRVPIVDEDTGRVIGSYESLPVVSVGVGKIDTNIIHSQKAAGADISRDFSNIQGRADTRAEEVKKFIKEYQSRHDGVISEDALRTANEMMQASDYSAGALETFAPYTMSALQMELAEFMWNGMANKTQSGITSPDLSATAGFSPKQKGSLGLQSLHEIEQSI